MEFRILGPLEVEADGHLLALGPTKQRALLALLILHVNRVVSREQVTDALWGEHPPGTAATAIHGYVSGLRKVLGKHRIETRPPGYVLHCDPGEIDLEHFERLVGDAQGLEPSTAAETLREALALWRGLPLGDLDAAPFVDAERRRLEEIRLLTIEERVDADLTLGRHSETIAELDGLVLDHPLRERLRGQLMLALYRSGRQADALEVYRRGRALLTDELGLEPGEGLRRLERGILEQDPALGPVAPPVQHRPDARRKRRRRLHAVVAVAILGVAGAAATGIALTSDAGGLLARADSVAVIDPNTNRFVTDVPVGRRPAAIAIGEGSVWVASAGDRTVSRIDPTTRKVVDTIGVGTDVHDLAVGFGSVWVADGADGTVTRIDPRTRTTETVPVGGPDNGSPQPVFWVATGTGGVWATSGDRVVRIDPTTRKVVTETAIPTPAGLAAGLGAVWVVTQDEQLIELSPRGDQEQRLQLNGDALAPAVGANSIWLVVYLGRGVIQQVDAATVSLAPGAATAAYPLDIAVGARAVWAVDIHGTVLRIDPTTTDVVARIATAPTARSAIAYGAGAIWVAVQDPL